MEVKEITNRDVDFAKWYTDVVKKADLVDYSGTKGSMIIRPLGYAIWEEIQKNLDRMFKETGHENVQMPMFIPESLLKLTWAIGVTPHPVKNAGIDTKTAKIKLKNKNFFFINPPYRVIITHKNIFKQTKTV